MDVKNINQMMASQKNYHRSEKESKPNKKSIQKSSLFDWSDPAEKKGVLFLVAVGLVIRLIYIFEIQSEPFVENLYAFPKVFDQMGWKLATEGGWIGNDIFTVAPLYSYALGFMYLIFGHSILIVQIFQSVVSSATIILIYFSAKNLFSKEVGLISAVIAAFYSLFIFYAGLILAETIFAFLIAAILYTFSSYEGDDKNLDWFGIGLLVGAAVLLKTSFLVFALVLIVWFIIKIFKSVKDKPVYYKSILLLLAGILIPILPATLNNYLSSGDFILVSSNNGLNFYLGNNEISDGAFEPPGQFEYFDDLDGHDYAQKELGYNIDPSGASDYW